MWPRFRLTPEEAKTCTKYPDPTSHKHAVVRRMYTNELNITNALRSDATQFQISRRSRVFGITAAGDIDQFMIELKNTVGEQFTAGPVHLVNLLTGWAPDPRSEAGLVYTNGITNVIATVRDDGPFIQEPNIVLPSNQTLNIYATPANPNDLVTSFRIELTLHVYEFPMGDSPY